MNALYRSEIERLYMLMYSKLFIYARSSLDNDALAEEAVQETFRIACMKPEAVCTSENPQGWLVNTMKNVIRNMAKSRASAQRVLTAYISNHVQEWNEMEDSIAVELLYQNIVQLEEYRILKDVAIDGKSYLEIAKEYDISLDACKKRVERAKKKLSGILQK